jgi:hypothetical protein
VASHWRDADLGGGSPGHYDAQLEREKAARDAEARREQTRERTESINNSVREGLDKLRTSGRSEAEYYNHPGTDNDTPDADPASVSGKQYNDQEQALTDRIAADQAERDQRVVDQERERDAKQAYWASQKGEPQQPSSEGEPVVADQPMMPKGIPVPNGPASTPPSPAAQADNDPAASSILLGAAEGRTVQAISDADSSLKRDLLRQEGTEMAFGESQILKKSAGSMIGAMLDGYDAVDDVATEKKREYNAATLASGYNALLDAAGQSSDLSGPELDRRVSQGQSQLYRFQSDMAKEAGDLKTAQQLALDAAREAALAKSQSPSNGSQGNNSATASPLDDALTSSRPPSKVDSAKN